jgi:hypothetical protein
MNSKLFFMMLDDCVSYAEDNCFEMSDYPWWPEVSKQLGLPVDSTRGQVRAVIALADCSALDLERENARLREALTDLHAIADCAYGSTDHETQAAFDSWMRGNRSLLPNAQTSDAPSGSTAFTTPPDA